MTELFPGMHIAKVHLHKRDGNAGQGISQANGRMGEPARVDDDGIALTHQAVNMVDDGAFVVALKAAQGGRAGLSFLLKALVDAL